MKRFQKSPRGLVLVFLWKAFLPRAGGTAAAGWPALHGRREQHRSAEAQASGPYATPLLMIDG